MNSNAPASGKSPASPPTMTPEEAKKELDRRHVARELLRPSTLAGNAIDQLKLSGDQTDAAALTLALREQTRLLSKENDLSRAEEMLICQAHTLDAMFFALSGRAAKNIGQYLDATESYMRLALRAQSQCRATLETLALLKNPPNATFVKQANIAHGPQQVNNGSPPPGARARERETENRQNELLEHCNGERLDPSAAGTASKANPAMAALGEGDRAKVRRR
ncbi:MAG: hypothetical protein M0038_01345 [Pseudomonadota bacterium]|nr:hypothetical protein [Pseudomonadota bacterium]